MVKVKANYFMKLLDNFTLIGVKKYIHGLEFMKLLKMKKMRTLVGISL